MRRVGIGILIAASVATAACAPAAPVQRRWATMGSWAQVRIVPAGDDGGAAAEIVRKAFDDVDRSMSNWDPSSALSAANAGARTGQALVEDEDLAHGLDAAFDAARRSGGAFDPTVGPAMTLWGFRPWSPRVPSDEEIRAVSARIGWEKARWDGTARTLRFDDPGMEIDLGGIAKGYALDLARRRLAEAGIAHALLDLGGNLLVMGRPPEQDSWLVGLRDPGEDGAVLGVLAVQDRAVSTSGNYENAFRKGDVTYGHLMDPRTARPAVTDVVAATAITSGGADGDALSTALAVAGSARAGALLAAWPGAEAVLVIREEGRIRVLASPSLEGRLVLDPEFVRRTGADLRFAAWGGSL